MTIHELAPQPAPVNEEWRPIAGYEGLYTVSNMGRVMSVERRVVHGDRTMRVRQRILKPLGDADTGLRVVLSLAGKRTMFLIHQLVGIAFVPNPLRLKGINHKDFDRTNNVHTNLEWGTQKYNIHYSMNADRMAKKLTPAGVKDALRRLALGHSQQAIADDLGVCQTTISRVKLGQTWSRYQP